MTSPEERLPARELPSALVRVWEARHPSSRIQIPIAVLAGDPDVRETDPGWIAVVPGAGAPNVFDRALLIARETAAAFQRKGLTIQTLVLPGRVVTDGDRVHRIKESLQDDLEQSPPALGSDPVAMTARVAAMLEHRQEIRRSIEYARPSGKLLPIRIPAGLRAWPPWRNPEIVGRRLGTLPRPETRALKNELLEKSLVRLVGPLGTGKSRFVTEAIADLQAVTIWTYGDLPLVDQLRAALQSGGTRGDLATAEAIAEVLAADSEWYAWQQSAETTHVPSPEAFERLFRRITARLGKPVCWVCDDMQKVSGSWRSRLADLADSSELGRSFRMIWIGRTATNWPTGSDSAPLVEMPGWNPTVFHTLVKQLTEGLDLPSHLLDIVEQQATGCPFAAEEAIFGLVHEQKIRRVYGNFFYAGGSGGEAVPSGRLIRHVVSEVARVGDLWPPTLLSAVRQAVPAEELRTATSLFGMTARNDWLNPFLDAGLLVERDSPWGSAIQWSNPLFGSAMRATLSPEDARRISVQIGALLDARSVRDEARQHAWELLSGSEEAVESLLERLKDDKVVSRDENLLETLAAELEAHRRRHGNTDQEFALIRHLLHQAMIRRQLPEFANEISRAEELAGTNVNRILPLAPILAEFYQQRGELHRALEAMHQALRLTSREGTKRRILMILQIGRLLARMHRHESAHALFTGLLDLLPVGDDSALRATCSFHLGNLELHAGRLAKALHLHQQALEIRRRREGARSIGESLCAIGAVQQAQGKFPAALKSFEEALEVLEPIDRPDDAAYALTGIGRIKMKLGDFPGASSALNRALELRRAANDRIGEALTELLVAENLLEMARATQAIHLVREAHFRLRMARLDQYVADAHQLLGRALLSLNQAAEAEIQLEAAQRAHMRTGDVQLARLDLSWRLRAAMASSDLDAVRRLLGQLVDKMRGVQGQDLEELVDFRIYRACEWLGKFEECPEDASSWLRRANDELLRRAERLEPQQRHQYLSDIVEHREILDRAAHLTP